MAEVNFLHIAMLLFLVCSLVLVGVSLMTAKPSAEQLEDLTWRTLSPDRRDPSLAHSRTRDMILTAVLLGLVAVIWVTFA